LTKGEDTPDSLRGLLGDLERDIAEWAWQQPPAELTVRQAYEDIGLKRKPPLAYTTVMTVMSHLVDKGVFTRRHEGKTHYYKVAQSREEFRATSAARQIERLVENFGDLALAQFAEQLAAADPQRLARIQSLLRKVSEKEE